MGEGISETGTRKKGSDLDDTGVLEKGSDSWFSLDAKLKGFSFLLL